MKHGGHNSKEMHPQGLLFMRKKGIIKSKRKFVMWKNRN